MTLAGCRRHVSTPAETLFMLAPRAGRVLEARLTRFAWAPVRRQRSAVSDRLDPARLELSGAAAALIEATQSDASARGRHDTGMALLLLGRDADGVAALEDAAALAPGDAAIWNDVAAARYTLAVADVRPDELPRALAAADRSLRLVPQFPDACFNRALIVEKLGITEASRRAWQRYLDADRSSGWASEAAQRLGRLPLVSDEADFKSAFAVARADLQHGNPESLTAIVRTYPQQARSWGEGPILASWADAVLTHDDKGASIALDTARRIAAVLAAGNHEQLLAGAVDAIGNTSSDPERRHSLAEGHTAYRSARLLYSRRRVHEAVLGFRQAAERFRDARSPMEDVAAYYIANCLYDGNRYAEALAALTTLESRIDRQNPGRFPALRAQIDWQRSLCEAALGEWGAAIRAASDASNGFGSLGEKGNGGAVGMILASDLDNAGQPRAAWKARLAALPALSRSGATDRIRNGITMAIEIEASRGDLDAATALAGLAIEDLHHANQMTGLAGAEADRAQLLVATGDVAEARQAVTRRGRRRHAFRMHRSGCGPVR